MEKNDYPGEFIVFEGLDGSGQSTQAELLENFLKEKGYDVVKTKEATKTSTVSQEIRDILDKKKKVSPQELQALFAKDREEHLNNFITPNLKGRKIVISDRYFFTSFAFGSIDVELSWLIKINNKFLMPDLTFFIDVRPDICLERIEKRGKATTLFEEKEKFEKVYKNFKKIIEIFPQIKIINGEKSIGEVFEEIKGVFCNYAPRDNYVVRSKQK